MNLDEIRMKWKNERKNEQAALNMWNSMATQFKRHDIPGNESLLLKIIENENMIQPTDRILDIGCGTGTYSAALAHKAWNITGVDLSPKMIEFGNEILDTHHINNVSLLCDDWSNFDISKNNFENTFDLVFAHMTPAISDATTFEKMIRCSKNHGILVKPTRRTDAISDEVMKIAGVEKNTMGRDQSILYAFDMLWLMGYKPKLEYEDQTWVMKKTLKEAIDMYTNRAKSYKNLSAHEEEKIKLYLEGKLEDGGIEEVVKTTICVICWSKR